MAHDGKWLLRIEDLDLPRCVPGADETIIQQLSACGLSWDEEIEYQSKRTHCYSDALTKLIDSEKAQVYRDWETDRKSTRLNSSHRL